MLCKHCSRKKANKSLQTECSSQCRHRVGETHKIRVDIIWQLA